MKINFDDLKVGDRLKIEVSVESVQGKSKGSITLSTSSGELFRYKNHESYGVTHCELEIGDWVTWQTHRNTSGGWGKIINSHGSYFWIALYGEEESLVTVIDFQCHRDDDRKRERSALEHAVNEIPVPVNEPCAVCEAIQEDSDCRPVSMAAESATKIDWKL